MSRTIIVKPTYWSYEDDEEENALDIHIGGQRDDGQTVHIIVQNFKPYIYIELPKKITWTGGACRSLYAYLTQIIRPAILGKYKDHASLCQKQKLHYKKDVLCLRVLVPTHKGGTRLRWRLCGSRSFAIADLDCALRGLRAAFLFEDHASTSRIIWTTKLRYDLR